MILIVSGTSLVSLDLDEEEKEDSHSEKMDVAFGSMKLWNNLPIHVLKNLWLCKDAILQSSCMLEFGTERSLFETGVASTILKKANVHGMIFGKFGNDSIGLVLPDSLREEILLIPKNPVKRWTSSMLNCRLLLDLRP